MIQTDEPCQSCERLRQENDLLRQQIRGLTDGTLRLPKISWLWRLGIGWILLSTLPLIPVWLLKLDGSAWRYYLICGISYSSPWTQGSILLSIVVLLAKPLSRKLVLAAFATLVLVLCWITISESANEAIEFAPLAPYAASCIAVPLFVCRVVWRWQIASQFDTSLPQPTSIATYLILTMAVATLTTASSLLSEDIQDAFGDGIFLAIFGGVLIACMMIAIALLAYFLNRLPLARSRGAVLCAWLMLCWAIAAASAYRGEYPNKDALLYAVFAASFAITFTLWYSAAMLWMRSLGYRLRSCSTVQKVRVEGRLT